MPKNSTGNESNINKQTIKDDIKMTTSCKWLGNTCFRKNNITLFLQHFKPASTIVKVFRL